MIRFITIAATAALLTVGCTADQADSQSLALQSCYKTDFGMKCIATPDGLRTEAVDVNGDGIMDTFACGDAPSDSDSDTVDGEGNTDSDEASNEDETESTEDGDADSESTSDSNSDSDEDCGPSMSNGDSTSDSISDADGDGDGDGVPDTIDCDCI